MTESAGWITKAARYRSGVHPAGRAMVSGIERSELHTLTGCAACGATGLECAERHGFVWRSAFLWRPGMSESDGTKTTLHPEPAPTQVWCPEGADPVYRGVWSSEKPTSQISYAFDLAERLSDALERWIEREGEQAVYESLATSYYLMQFGDGSHGWARTIMEYNYERGSLPDVEKMVRVTLTPEQDEEFWNAGYGDLV